MELEQFLREYLATGEDEALLTVWIDDEGELIISINDCQPHYVVQGDATNVVEYHQEH
jgi:hypothetical protein